MTTPRPKSVVPVFDTAMATVIAASGRTTAVRDHVRLIPRGWVASSAVGLSSKLQQNVAPVHLRPCRDGRRRSIVQGPVMIRGSCAVVHRPRTSPASTGSVVIDLVMFRPQLTKPRYCIEVRSVWV